MKDKLKKVIKILEEEYQVYSQLSNIAEKKQEVVVEEDLDALETVVREEADCIEQLQEWEEKRVELVGNTELSELKEKTSNSNQKQRLDNLQTKLNEIIEELQILNDTNDKLVRDALQLVNLEINSLTGNQKQGTYGKGGQTGGEQSTQKSSVINHKA